MQPVRQRAVFELLVASAAAVAVLLHIAATDLGLTPGNVLRAVSAAAFVASAGFAIAALRSMNSRQS